MVALLSDVGLLLMSDRDQIVCLTTHVSPAACLTTPVPQIIMS